MKLISVDTPIDTVRTDEMKPDKVKSDEKKCPYCAETIKAEAIVCRFCNQELTA